jgi:DNA-directed RNA polymerase subunit RPC12/RpoP
MKKKKEKEPTPSPEPLPSELSDKLPGIKCAYCGTLNPIDVIRCIHCNASLKDVKLS